MTAYNMQLESAKKLWQPFHTHGKKRRNLAMAQDELGLPKHMLTTETPTRWGSRQMMIQRVLEQERAISQVLKADRKSRHLVLSWQDMDVLEAVNKVCRCFFFYYVLFLT